ncbi:MAG: hypothetical protein Kow00120_27510 [Anaerolineae bacterium]
MRLHHLNCGTIRVFGGVAMIGTGSLRTRAPGVIHCGDAIQLTNAHDPHELDKFRAGEPPGTG